MLIEYVSEKFARLFVAASEVLLCDFASAIVMYSLPFPAQHCVFGNNSLVEQYYNKIDTSKSFFHKQFKIQTMIYSYLLRNSK